MIDFSALFSHFLFLSFKKSPKPSNLSLTFEKDLDFKISSHFGIKNWKKNPPFKNWGFTTKSLQKSWVYDERKCFCGIEQQFCSILVDFHQKSLFLLVFSLGRGLENSQGNGEWKIVRLLIAWMVSKKAFCLPSSTSITLSSIHLSLGKL